VNILDETIIDSQRQRLWHWRIAIRHMGYDVGRQGMKDQEILTLLHRLRRPTFFTRDEDFYARHLCHARCGSPPAFGFLWSSGYDLQGHEG
jgi:hypothetical protein